MKLPKPSAETIAYFERIAPGPPIEARKLFGMPTRFLNGHMLVGLFGDTFMLHLSESDREECIRAGAKPFAPMGRESKGYVDVKPGTFDDRTLKEWIVRGMRYLGSLPPKLKASVEGAASTRGRAESKRDGAGPPSAAKPTTARASEGTAPSKKTKAKAKSQAKASAAPAQRTKPKAKPRTSAKARPRKTTKKPAAKKARKARR